jgi:hypothetical protein
MRYRLFRRSRHVKSTTVEPKMAVEAPMEPEESPKLRKSRIPPALQAVFLASNRGHEVHEPPPAQAAHRSFGRFWKRRAATTAGGPKPATVPASPGRTAHSESADTTESTSETNNSETPVGTYVNCSAADKHNCTGKPKATIGGHKTDPCPTKKVVKVREVTVDKSRSLDTPCASSHSLFGSSVSSFDHT